MRKVMFKRWIPRETIRGGESSFTYETTITGTACWESEYTHEGLFHQWAAAYEDSGEGFGNYTVGIIELPDGTIEQILPTNIKFIE